MRWEAFSPIGEIEAIMNRKIANQLGVPANTKTISNDNAKYVEKVKRRNARYLTQLAPNTPRRQIINHVNTKHNQENTLKIEVLTWANYTTSFYKWWKDYGGIAIIYEPIPSSNGKNRILRCARFGYGI